MKEDLWLLQRGKKVRIFCPEEENSAVRHAALSLAEDMEKTCGSVVELLGEWNGEDSPDIPAVVIATAGTPWLEHRMPGRERCTNFTLP